MTCRKEDNQFWLRNLDCIFHDLPKDILQKWVALNLLRIATAVFLMYYFSRNGRQSWMFGRYSQKFCHFLVYIITAEQNNSKKWQGTKGHNFRSIIRLSNTQWKSLENFDLGRGSFHSSNSSSFTFWSSKLSSSIALEATKLV